MRKEQCNRPVSMLSKHVLSTCSTDLFKQYDLKKKNLGVIFYICI